MSNRMKTGRSPAAIAVLLGTAAILACVTAQQESQGPQIVRGANAPAVGDSVRLTIDAPAAEVPVDSPVRVRMHLEGFTLGVPTPGADARHIAKSAQGQHVHLILDAEPYRAIYDLSQPVDLGVLSPGWHVLRAFPSRQWHESVKADGAFALRWFHVGPAGGPPPVEPSDPILTYSRPNGTYAKTDADSIMVDFYLSNVTLTPDGYRVRLGIDDTLSMLITAWVPYYVVGLSAGKHGISLDLIDADGADVPGPYNNTSRTITVER